MGIRNLNKLLLNKCYNSIYYIHLSELSGKKIAIDVSIYLYKYERNGRLLKNMIDMMKIFKYYNIIPIFIFDGKPPKEKKNILDKRREEKRQNKEKIYKLKEELEEIKECNNDLKIKEIMCEINKIENQIIIITKDKIEEIKNIIRREGMTYFDAPQEADELCAMLVIREQVWCCISDDMDLFVYGCPRVIRDFNIYKCSGKIYNMDDILYDLSKIYGNMGLNDFKQICILSGTDYNYKSNNINFNISYVMELFKIYNDNKYLNNVEYKYDFINWLMNVNEINMDKINMDELINIYDIFDLSDDTKLFQFSNILIENI
jgi:flap endonuclease-1